METHVDCAAPRYFRCVRLAATITAPQCRANRDHCERLATLFELLPTAISEPPPLCRDCPQAPQVDAGQVRFFTAPEVLAGLARAQSPLNRPLPAELRFGAQPSEHADFTSAFWVPEWDF